MFHKYQIEGLCVKETRSGILYTRVVLVLLSTI